MRSSVQDPRVANAHANPQTTGIVRARFDICLISGDRKSCSSSMCRGPCRHVVRMGLYNLHRGSATREGLADIRFALALKILRGLRELMFNLVGLSFTLLPPSWAERSPVRAIRMHLRLKGA
jgi:hypothetical protein